MLLVLRGVMMQGALAGKSTEEHKVTKQQITRDGLFTHHLYNGLVSLHYTDNGGSRKQVLTDQFVAHQVGLYIDVGFNNTNNTTSKAERLS